MSVTGDWSKLEKALRELDALGSPTVMGIAAKNVAVAMTTEVQLTFRKEQSPDGGKWAPLKRGRKRKGKGKRDNKILRDTGRLANSITGVAAGNNVIVGTNVEYAAYHQEGTSRIPARPFLPLAGLPMAWQNSAARVIVEVLKQTAPMLLSGAAE